MCIERRNLKQFLTGSAARKHTSGMFIIGGMVWLFYLGYVNLLTIGFGVHHLAAEISGIPISWIINYLLNTKLNFHQPIDIRRFASFCGVSSFGWGIYLVTTILFSDMFGAPTWLGTIVGVLTKTISNVVFQQAITFGKYGRKEIQEPRSSSAMYDWDAVFIGNPIQKWWKTKIIMETLRMTEGNPVLDIGCGSSPMLALIPEEEKYGIDRNEDKIEFIKRQDPTSKYYTMDGTHTCFTEESMSTVICNEVIEHHTKPNELVKELARITKPGGVVIISTPDYSSIIWNAIEILWGLLMRSGYELEHGSKFTQTGVVALCNAYGLEFEEGIKIARSDMVLKFRKVISLN